MEKKKTTDEEHDLLYYLGGNEEDTSSKTTEQKDILIPKWEEVRKQEKRAPIKPVGVFHRENSDHEQHVYHHRMQCHHSTQRTQPFKDASAPR